jgi:hypothetical protein
LQASGFDWRPEGGSENCLDMNGLKIQYIFGTPEGVKKRLPE